VFLWQSIIVIVWINQLFGEFWGASYLHKLYFWIPITMNNHLEECVAMRHLNIFLSLRTCLALLLFLQTKNCNDVHFEPTEFCCDCKLPVNLYLLFIPFQAKDERTVHHFHFTQWPDHGVPDNIKLVSFYRKVKRTKTTLNGPLTVHCR
jgi:protein tyrosine phosphatase